MNSAVCLLIYSLTVIVLGPPLLRRLTRTGLAPGLGVVAWLTAIASVLFSWAAAAALLVVEATGSRTRPGGFVASCLARLCTLANGGAGVAAQVIMLALAAATALGAIVTTVRVATSMSRMRARAHDHADAVRLVGHPASAHDVVIVDAVEPAAYCVSGRPSAIVVTSAALTALNDSQLAAVLAHERAHLAGHHAIVLATLRSLVAVFPKLTLITQGAAEVSRLLEMCADDAAIRQHGRGPLLSGLLALCDGVPAEALAAADVAVLARAERLTATRVVRATARARVGLTTAITMLVAGPAITAALAASSALLCRQ